MRLAKNTEEKRGQERRREKRRRRNQHVCPEIPNVRWLLRRWAHLWAREDVFWTLHGFPDFSADSRRSAAPFCLSRVHPETRGAQAVCRLSPVTSEQEQLLQPRPVTGQHSVAERLECRLEGMGTTPQPTVSPVQNPEQISDECATTALHTMQDRLQQTTVIAQRRSQNMLYEQSASKKKAMQPTRPPEALTQARERQEESEAPLRAEVRGGRRGRENVQRHHQGHS